MKYNRFGRKGNCLMPFFSSVTSVPYVVTINTTCALNVTSEQRLLRVKKLTT